MRVCMGCKKEAGFNLWVVTNYHGLTGQFCETCYTHISHRDDKPCFPHEYLMILLRQEKENGKETHTKKA